ncbi:hypothetical protein PFAG_01881 [Plasmodium falciparum Santa Lucia]|nr:hypothetical protein PFAG_01881 [Plasmodium falciparum Santa Lucia]
MLFKIFLYSCLIHVNLSNEKIIINKYTLILDEFREVHIKLRIHNPVVKRKCTKINKLLYINYMENKL